MEYRYIVFSSVTYSLRAMSLLQKIGIASRLEKIKNIPSLGGCGYALAVKSNMLDSAVDAIVRDGTRIIEILDSKENRNE